MHAVDGRTSSPLPARPQHNPHPSVHVPGPWERMAQRWPHSLPPSHSMSSISERGGGVPPPRRLAGPRELPTSTSLIDDLRNMCVGPRDPQYEGSRYRTVSGSASPANKPLPPLPPARTPSQFHHQRMSHVAAAAAAAAASQQRGPPAFLSTRQHLHQQQHHMRLPSAPPSLPTPSAHRHGSQPVDPRGGGVPVASATQTHARTHRMHERPRFPSDCSPIGTALSATTNRAEPTSGPRPHSTSPTKASQRTTPAQQPSRGELLPAMPMPTAISISSPSDRRFAGASAARVNPPSRLNPVPAAAVAPPSQPSTSSNTRHLPSASAELSPPPPSYDVLFGPRVTFEEDDARTSRAQTEPAVQADSSSTPVTSTTKVIPLPPLKPGQCWGIKRDGGRCTRIVAESSTRSARARASQTPSPTKPRKHGPTASDRRRRHVSEPLSTSRKGDASKPIVISDDGSSSSSDCDGDGDGDGSDFDSSNAIGDAATRRPGTLPIYCHQHAKEINKSPGFHLPEPPHTYIPFENYIGPDLSPTTAARLRIAMTESLTPADMATPGYIYIYELLPESSTPTPSPTDTGLRLRLKIGRSHHPMNRIAQWRSQCVNRTPVLRRLYPQVAGPSSSSSNAVVPTQRQGLIVGADSVLTQGLRGSHKWEKVVHIELAERCTRLVERCEDCGKRHREIFETTAAASVEDEFRMVCDVVAKWEKFVRVCVEHRGMS